MPEFPALATDSANLRTIEKAPPRTAAHIGANVGIVGGAGLFAGALLFTAYHGAVMFTDVEPDSFIFSQESWIQILVLCSLAVSAISSLLLVLWNFQFHGWAKKAGRRSSGIISILISFILTGVTLGVPWPVLVLTGRNMQKEGTSGGRSVKVIGIVSLVTGLCALGVAVADGTPFTVVDTSVTGGPLSLVAGSLGIVSFGLLLYALRRMDSELNWLSYNPGPSGNFTPNKVTLPSTAKSASESGYLTNAGLRGSRTAEVPAGAGGLIPGQPEQSALPIPTKPEKAPSQPAYVSQYTFEDEVDTPFITVETPAMISVPMEARNVAVKTQAPEELYANDAVQEPPEAPVPVAPPAVPTVPAPSPAPEPPVAYVPAAPVVPVVSEPPVAYVPVSETPVVAPPTAIPTPPPYTYPPVVPPAQGTGIPVAPPTPASGAGYLAAPPSPVPGTGIPVAPPEPVPGTGRLLPPPVPTAGESIAAPAPAPEPSTRYVAPQIVPAPVAAPAATTVAAPAPALYVAPDFGIPTPDSTPSVTPTPEISPTQAYVPPSLPITGAPREQPPAYVPPTIAAASEPETTQSGAIPDDTRE